MKIWMSKQGRVNVNIKGRNNLEHWRWSDSVKYAKAGGQKKLFDENRKIR